MTKIRWTDRAARDLQDQHAWLMQQDKGVAELMAKEVHVALDRMAGRVDIGRPSRYGRYREKSIPKWNKLVIYDRDETFLTVIAILDTRMLPPEELK